MKRRYGLMLAFAAACMVTAKPCIYAEGAQSSVIEKVSVNLTTGKRE